MQWLVNQSCHDLVGKHRNAWMTEVSLTVLQPQRSILELNTLKYSIYLATKLQEDLTKSIEEALLTAVDHAPCMTPLTFWCQNRFLKHILGIWSRNLNWGNCRCYRRLLGEHQTVKVWKIYIAHLRVTTVRTICEILTTVLMAREIFPEVRTCKLIRIYMTIPVTTATAERSFSALRRIKTRSCWRRSAVCFFKFSKIRIFW